MNTAEAIRVALSSLWANKLRSVLTLLGVVIGVSAVIAVVTFVNGINSYVATKIFNLGADVFIVSRQSASDMTNAEKFLESQKRKNIEIDDYRAIAAGCTECAAVGAAVSNNTGHVRHDEREATDVNIRGYTPSMVRITDFDLVAGRFITETDMQTVAAVAIIGSDVQDNIMGATDPIGKEIRIDGHLYTVVGIGKPQGKTMGQSQDNYVIIPLTTYLRQYGTRQSIGISAKAHGIGESLDRAVDQTRVIMRARRHDRPGQPDSFSEETNASLMGLWSGLSGTFFVAMIGIASISLVIGGIVIMNMQLVSVTERTREIGVRKALGARRADVMRQFVIESSTIALVGGMVGVILGISFAKLVTAVIGMPSSIEFWSVMAGLLLATSVGIFFGVYPARRAAMLDPIAALRFEL
ncbi:MAG TPA: ABC transporter permease [Terriglobales bacterium]|nr:ABC transporter permease [Terriglobales bacterium]